jgi:rod shape-determining protein MreC
MAVMTADGIVGKVLVAYASVSQVLLISDQSSGVGALLEKTRLQGVLRGTANGEVVLERVMSDEQVPVGETVLTSGGDQIFPKGLPVGTISKVGAPKDLFLSITVKPSANLDRLEEVLVVLQKQEKQAVATDAPRARAADILAQRLPSVPQQPATVPAAGAVAGQTPTNSAASSASGAKPAVADQAAASKKLTSPAVAPQTAKPQDLASQPKSSAPQSATPPPPDADTPH